MIVKVCTFFFNLIIIQITCFNLFAQNNAVISGHIIQAIGNKPIQNATIHQKGSLKNTMTDINGAFMLQITNWKDSVEITSVGFEPVTMQLEPAHAINMLVVMKTKINSLDEIVIGSSKKPGKSFMQLVIDEKENNNPSRFRSFSYQRYTRNELDMDNIDFQKTKHSGLKSLMLETYADLDSTAKYDKELPVYFAEKLANIYHSTAPKINRENIIAKKNLGLKTDELLSKLDKFYFHFNVYDEWIAIFDQTYVSPLNANAFRYYNFFEGKAVVENADTLQQILFTPRNEYERVFKGFLWINKKSLAITTVNMHLSKTANINFVNDINYFEDYKVVFDSVQSKEVYMPYKFTSEVKFESGLALLGIPIPENKSSIKFIIKNTSVTDKIIFNPEDPATVVDNLIKKESTGNWEKSDLFWEQHRLESLTNHEKNIYKMVDSLKQNNRFNRDVKLIAFAGTGYWDFSKYARIGPYSSFISSNSLEGLRIRMGFWTMPAISKKINLFGYAAYGTKDKKLKGMLGLKYVWNDKRWTKTTMSFGSDYDFIIDQDDELDKDNIFHSLLRKKIPFTRTYIKQGLIKHEQYLTPDLSAKVLVIYKELNPVFDFKYRPINPLLDKPYDSVFAKRLPVAEATIGIRYAHNERTRILNYDNIKLGTFYPVFTANYTYGIEVAKALFNFNKINVGIEQRLRLPPKMMLYYKLEMGKVFGTIPYILLNIPAGNEYYFASKYQFNTMAPYEFASDKYASLHTRLYLGGTFFDKIPLLQKWGWRERLSFNAYYGSMNQENKEYNKYSNFNLIGKIPFMEASIGIENIFHVISIDYFRRINYLNNPYAKKGGIYLGLTLVF